MTVRDKFWGSSRAVENHKDSTSNSKLLESLRQLSLKKKQLNTATQHKALEILKCYKVTLNLKASNLSTNWVLRLMSEQFLPSLC